MSIEVGQEAPDFTLRNQDREDVTLSSFRGQPVVLVFYPFDFSPPCTQEHCEIRDDYQSWTDKGAKVLGVSGDSFFVHKAFREQQDLQHDLLSDMGGAVSRQYETWNDTAHASERRTVVIDPDGKVVFTTKSGSLPEVRDHSTIEGYLS
ncbi:MAG: redoxin domain-containing protein [Dehalococcoidia bacterium]|nr:redoxin domain-containing protein [Dehalococcoidia bacterium]